MEFNLFDNYSNEAYDIRRGRISTWLYLVLLGTTMTIITIFNMKASYWKIVTVHFPSEKQYEYLYRQYPDTLSCPCTSVSNPYGSFVQLTLRQHQLCDSPFVQSWFYQNLNIIENDSPVSNSSVFILSYFRTLAMLCDITKATLNDTIRQFSLTTFLSSHVRQKQVILLQTEQHFKVLKSSVTTEFSNIISLINEVLHTNQYISGQQTNILIRKVPFNNSTQTRIVTMTNTGYDDDGQPCYCTQNALCNIQPLYQDSLLSTIPGLSFNCFLFDSVLKSSLICWYHSDCVNKILKNSIISNISNMSTLPILDDKSPSKFLPNTKIKVLLDDLMVEEWDLKINYTAFYDSCHPIHCTYAYYDKYNALYLITIMMGIFGGLDVIVRIVCLIFVRFLLRLKSTSYPVSTLIIDLPNTDDRKYEKLLFTLDIIQKYLLCRRRKS